MKQIVNIYKKGVKINLDDIQKILKSLKMDGNSLMPAYRQVLNMSSQNIANKWLTGRKYARTYFAQKAFGKFYPKKHIELSLTIDAMVDILDDFYDEKISKEKNGLYLIEYLRVFALHNSFAPEKKMQKAISHYFNQLISLAVAENVFLDLIKKEKKLENLIKYSSNLLLCRAMDIDIFNEIALINYDRKVKKNIMKIGRIFRAINIFTKDIKDIEYDKKNGMESVVTHLFSRKSLDFSLYINGLMNYFKSEAYNIAVKSKEESPQIKIPIDNFYKMMLKDIKTADKLIKK